MSEATCPQCQSISCRYALDFGVLLWPTLLLLFFPMAHVSFLADWMGVHYAAMIRWHRYCGPASLSGNRESAKLESSPIASELSYIMPNHIQYFAWLEPPQQQETEDAGLDRSPFCAGGLGKAPCGSCLSMAFYTTSSGAASMSSG